VKQKCIAVFDVGKSNKKILLYDNNLNILDSLYETFNEFSDGGVNYEPIGEITQWFFDSMMKLSSLYDIEAVSVTAHGATFVCVDKNGEITVPVLSYTTDPGEDFHTDFYQKFGNADTLHKKYLTPKMPGLGCMAKAIYFCSLNYKKDYERTHVILNFPQYFGFLLTGKHGAEYTYMGNHTYLWDFEKNDYSFMVDKLGIRGKLPEKISAPWDVLGTVSGEASKRCGLSEDTVVTMGIHDSNASLLPYLVSMKDNFVLNSSGSVMVAMRKSEKLEIGDNDLGKALLYNCNVFSDPVRTAIFLAGLEFDLYVGQLRAVHEMGELPLFNREIFELIINEKKLFIIPSIIPIGILPSSSAKIIEGGTVYTFGDISAGNRPDFFNDMDTAYAVLCISLAIHTMMAIKQVGLEKGDTVYIEGGFRKNDSFMSVLSALLPDNPVSLSNLEEATSFGAAVLARSAISRKSPADMKDSFSIETQEVSKPDFTGVDNYVEEFMKYTI